MTKASDLNANPSPFEADLRRFGPDATQAPLTLPEAQAYTLDLATSHYENFPVISVFVPKRLRPHFANIYAFCRWADDLGDEVGDPGRSLELLDWWQESTEAMFNDGAATHPVMIALRPTVGEFGIPPKPFLDLISAFRRDQTQTRYETFDDLCSYCRCSADPVGELVLYLAQRHTAEHARLSGDVCTGLQLTNFWQDVSRDVDIGRIYLPLEDCRRFGVSEHDVLQRRYTESFGNLLAFEVDRAEELLHRGLPLARRMPGRLRFAVALFAHGGLSILHRLRAIDYNVFAQRPVLHKSDVLLAVLKTLGAYLPGGRGSRRAAAKD